MPRGPLHLGAANKRRGLRWTTGFFLKTQSEFERQLHSYCVIRSLDGRQQRLVLVMEKSPAPPNWLEFRSSPLDEGHVPSGPHLPSARSTGDSFEETIPGSARRLPGSLADAL